MQRSVEKLVAQALVHCLVYEQANQRALQKTELSSKKKLWYFGSEAERADLCVCGELYMSIIFLCTVVVLRRTMSVVDPMSFSGRRCLWCVRCRAPAAFARIANIKKVDSKMKQTQFSAIMCALLSSCCLRCL